MREIVLDTESTGLDPNAGHRLVEIGCVEIFNLVPTGKSYSTFLNPERDIPLEATNIHGITTEFAMGHPVFADEVEKFLEFIGDAPLIIHNATFDMKFINHELTRLGRDPIPLTRAVDTLAIARRKYPGQPASLDALCRRFGVDNSKRDKHGAVIDAELLAGVYLELSGGRQPDLAVEVSSTGVDITIGERTYRLPRIDLPGCQVAIEEQAAHQSFLDKLKNPMWRLLDEADAALTA